MSDARATLELRNTLQQWLQPDELRGISWGAVLNAAAPAIDRGWTADELARWCIADLGGTPPDNPGAIIVNTLRTLGNADPPRDTTPTPRHITDIHQANAHAQRAAQGVNHTAWVQRIRAS